MSNKGKQLSEMDHLDDLFSVARSTPPRMSEDLQSAILTDAHELQHSRRLASALQDIPDQAMDAGDLLPRIWQQFTSAVGGWPALGGLAAASLSGLWIGLAPPSFLPDPVDSFVSYANGAQLISDLDYDVSLLMGDEVFE